MTDGLAELDEQLAAFAAAEDAHPQVLLHVESAITGGAPHDVTLEEALERFALTEKQRAILLADGDWTDDLTVFLGHTLTKIDPALRAAFPTVNTVIEGAGSAFPGGSLALHALLAIAEGPLLTLLEAWLQGKANAIEKARTEARGG